MRYPVLRPSTIPGSGTGVYLYLLENYSVPARLPHEVWYNGQQKKLDDPHDPFKGYFPVGKTLKLSYGGSDMRDYTFTGEERNPIFVKDLSEEALMELGIRDAKPDEKIFNPNFVAYDELSQTTKASNEATTMSLAKSISSFLCTSKDILYTEKDIVEMLTVAIDHADSQEMRHILHGNHIAWCSIRFMETGIMEENIKKQFYGQNDIDFYIKDIGTIMPSILYTLAILGVNPIEMIKKLDYDLWDIKNVAARVMKFMKPSREDSKEAKIT